MTAVEETMADYAGRPAHPRARTRSTYFRDAARTKGSHHRRRPRPPARTADRVRTAGSVIVRQRPGTAKGLLFLTLEDETGMSQAVVSPDLLQKHRKLIVGSPGLVVEGVLQKRDGTLSVKGERFWSLKRLVAVPSHDWH